MGEWLMGRLLNRTVGPTSVLPRWVRALLDETFLWVAAGQLLLALGVSRESVSRLAQVQSVLADARGRFGAAGHELPHLEDVTTYGDLDVLSAQLDDVERILGPAGPSGDDLTAILPAPLAARWLQGSGLIVIDLLEEVLGRLRILRIRTELVGLDHRALLALLSRVRRELGARDLEVTAQGGYGALRERLAQLDHEVEQMHLKGLETRPVAPGLGEVRRIVSILRAIPQETLDRLLPLRLLSSRVVLGTAITKALDQLRKSWVPPEQRVPAQAQQEIAREQRTQQLRADRARRRREVAEHDARPVIRRRYRAQALLLWTLSLVLAGWLGLTAVEIIAPATLDQFGLPTSRAWLWPVPALIATIAAATAAIGVQRVALGDEVDLDHRATRAEAGATPARRGRGRAARAAEVVITGVVLIPIVFTVLLALAEPFGWWSIAEDPETWIVPLSMVPPMMATLLANVVGAGVGKSHAERRRAQRASGDDTPRV